VNGQIEMKDASGLTVSASQEVRTPPLLLRLFNRRWFLATLLVVIGVGINIRLGIWQLDRLEKRRAFNARVLAQVNQPELDLQGAGLEQDLTNMEYRMVVVTGEYDPTYEVALRNQSWGNQIGVHLLTPLHITGSDQYILIDRGWVPDTDFIYDGWGEYAEQGPVTVHGIIRASQSKPDYGRRADPTPAPGGVPLKAWYFANVEQIAKQVPYRLLPVYVQQAPEPAWTGLPHRTQPDLEITEGPHMSYAIQWFTFAAILGIGYPFFVRRQERRLTNPPSTSQEGTQT
jgi:surfeit locus 1 family protein